MRKWQVYIERYPDFPKPGVVYYDFSPLIASPKIWEEALDELESYLEGIEYTVVAAIDAKGFILGAALAQRKGLPLVLVRKSGLVPGEVYTREFEKEYGRGSYQMQKGALDSKDRVLVAYDILAGPGASKAAFELVEEEASVAAGVYITELEYLGGREELSDYEIHSLYKVFDA